MITRRKAALACTALVTSLVSGKKVFAGERVTSMRVPQNGLQPQVAVDERGVLHLIYYTGDPHKGDVYYSRSGDGGSTFSAAQRVNSQPGSAIAAGPVGCRNR